MIQEEDREEAMEMGRGLGVGVHGRTWSSANPPTEEDMDLRRGPWTVDEDLVLMNYIAAHGEGRWNCLARCAGNGFNSVQVFYII